MYQKQRRILFTVWKSDREPSERRRLRNFAVRKRWKKKEEKWRPSIASHYPREGSHVLM